MSVWESRPVVPEYRARRALAVIGVLSALAFAAPRFLTHTPYARLGVTLGRSTSEGYPTVDRVLGPPAQGVLRTGDVLITADGEPMHPPATLSSLRRPTLPREPFTLVFRRDGSLNEVTLPPVRLSPWQRLRVLLLPLAAVVAAPLVAFALVWRRPDLSTAWVFLWFAALQAVSVVHEVYRFPEVDPTSTFKVYLQFYGVLCFWTPASFVHLMAVMPRPRWTASSRWRSPWFWLVVAGYLAPIAFAVRFLTRAIYDQEAFGAFQTIATGIGVIALVQRYGPRPGDDTQPSRAQRALALVASALLLLASVLGWMLENDRLSPLLQMSQFRLMITIVSLGALSTPFIIAFLIARDPVFDPRRLLEKGLPYALLSGVLAALYLAIVLLGQRLFAQVTGEQAVVVNVVAALVVAFVFMPLRERMQRALDRLYRRDPRALREALDRAGRELLQALDRDDARASVEAALTRGIGRQVQLDWPDNGPPRIAPGEDLPPDARGAVENLLMQAGIRLENLALADERAAAERRAVELREAATRAELRALHAQVQPHFLFNALNALSYLTETDPRAAQRFTERLADMLRYSVEAGARSAALLSDEIAFVEDYLGVARERYEGDLSFHYRGDRELLSAPVPPLLLQPLVENSLKHGLAPGARGLALDLDARRDDGWMTLTFSDDGTASGNGAPGFGVGLENLEQRVRRFAGADASMVAGKRDEGGYAVTLRWRVNGGGGHQ